MAPAIRIQLVLYGNAIADLFRTLTAICATVRHARGEHAIGDAVVAIGDCSPVPTVLADDLAAVQTALDDFGISSTYEFFAANLGSAGGSNRLAAGGDEPFIWVLNPDTYPSPRCLGTLLAAINDPAIAAVDGRQLPVEHPKGYDPVTGRATWVSGACMVLRRSAFEQVGWFDEHHFPLYCDDVDLSWRLRLAGHELRTAPRAVVFHDKRVGFDGRPAGSEREIESGALARLLLAVRYGRPDVVERGLADLSASDVPAHQRAAAAFVARRIAGDLPDPLTGAERVAEFDLRYYSAHRFEY